MLTPHNRAETREIKLHCLRQVITTLKISNRRTVDGPTKHYFHRSNTTTKPRLSLSFSPLPVVFLVNWLLTGSRNQPAPRSRSPSNFYKRSERCLSRLSDPCGASPFALARFHPQNVPELANRTQQNFGEARGSGWGSGELSTFS